MRDIEYHWLLENTESGLPVYIHKEQYTTTTDPWMAKRFSSKEEAAQYLVTESLSDQGYCPVEHGFCK